MMKAEVDANFDIQYSIFLVRHSALGIGQLKIVVASAPKNANPDSDYLWRENFFAMGTMASPMAMHTSIGIKAPPAGGRHVNSPGF